MLEARNLKAVVRNRGFIILVKTAGRLKLSPIMIENKRVEKTPYLLF